MTASLPAIAANVDVHWPVAASCVAAAAALAVVSARSPRPHPVLVNVGPFVVVAVVFALVMATGGAVSPYEVLYVPLTGYVAAFRERIFFVAVLVTSVVAALVPSLLDPGPGRIVVEGLIWGAVALTLVVVHRVASGLRDANRLYVSVLENHTGPTYLLSADGTIQWVNGPAQKVLGMELDEIVGLPWPEVVARREPERLMPAFLAALEGEPQGIAFRTDAPGGSYLLRGTILPVERYGRNVAVMGITQDVTELHAAAFGAEALRWALDSLAIPVAIFDADTRQALYANDAAAMLMIGAADGRSGDISWDRLWPDLVQDLPPPGTPHQVTIDLSEGGEGRQLDVSVECLEGDRELVVYTAVDVSERGRRERELERIAELERDTASRLRDLDRLKNAFLTAVSHELRTPTTVILGVARSLKKFRGDTDPRRRERLEDALVRHADRLADLLADLLDLGRLTGGTARIQPEPFDLVALARKLVERDPQRHIIRIDAPATLSVRSDRVQIERIIENLLGNAAKYAAGAPVTLAIRPLADGGFRLTVSDEGPGIPETELDRVFEPFHRVDLDHPQPGTGIGLALVAEFAAIHGGRAWAERVAARGGTRIVVDIPERRGIAADPDRASAPTEVRDPPG